MNSIRSALVTRILAILLLATLATGCTAKVKKERSLKRAENYFASGELEKAKIEYLNVLRLDPLNPVAIERIGFIWSEQGAPINAWHWLKKANEISPNTREVRSKFALASMSVGDLDTARSEALGVLQLEPNNGEALFVLVECIRTKETLELAEEQLGKFPRPESADFQLASAGIAARKGDKTAAETALRKAIALDPKSGPAHAAFGAFLAGQKNVVDATAELKTASELSPLRSGIRIRYAEYLAQTGQIDEAKRVLGEMTTKVADYLPAWRVLAQIAASEKKYDESLALIENVVVRDPENLDARMLQAEVWRVKGDLTKTVETLERMERVYIKLPTLKYQLARAYVQSNNLERAVALLNQAVALAPDYAEAALMLAELNLRQGKPDAVVAPMVDLTTKRPELMVAHVFLADAYRALGRLDQAEQVVRDQIIRTPDNPQPYLILGLVQRLQNKHADARKSFEEALTRGPDDLTVIYQLVDLDLLEKKFAAAHNRIAEQLAKKPDSAGTHFLEGRVFAAEQNRDRAEASLLKSVELDPNATSAYQLLVSIYVAEKKLPQAAAQLEAFLSKNPRNLAAWMTLGSIHDQTGDYAKGREVYEKLIALNPEFAPALNNLAYLYSERFNDLPKAHELARKARGLNPGDAAIADTLGWILYKRGEYQQAFALLQESASKLTTVPEVQFHLGMVSYMMGELDNARVALRKAVDAPAEFAGKEDARARLASIEGGTPAELTIADAKAAIERQPNDPIARLRLAGAYEKAGDPRNAAQELENALQINPKLFPATVRLAELMDGPLNDVTKALEYARKARELAPNDPKAAGVLGRIANKTGNANWAYGLLQESNRAIPNDPPVLHSLAWAAYRLSKVKEAQEAMENVVKTAPGSKEAADAKRFLVLTRLEDESPDLEAASPEIAEALKSDEKYLPALMARGAIERKNGKKEAAIQTYTLVTRLEPDFGPGLKRLAELHAENPAQTEKANELAVKARKFLPNDVELAKLLARISFARKEYRYTVQLLRETERSGPLDAQSLYYLGASYAQLKDAKQSREFLEKAVAAGLQEPFATEATRLLAAPEKQ